MASKDEQRSNRKKKKHNKTKNANNESNNDGDSGGAAKLIEDKRFAPVHSDPRFGRFRKQTAKVEIDDRFTKMFTDKNFAKSSVAPVDKRGKLNKQKSDASLSRYYKKEEEEKDEEENIDVDDEEEESDFDSKLKSSESSESESESASEEDEDESSTDDEDERIVYEEEEDDDDEVEVENVPLVEDGTRRLAVVNMDWRHVRAVDLYVVLRSFLPKGGDILSVAVYPSEFGLQWMKEEEIHGPVGLFDKENEKDSDDDDDSNNDEINYEKLRDYEKSRLRYYYAVVECDSVATAEHLYKNCDRLEFERSANVLDLRFIPDSMEFKHPPRDVAKEAPTSYEGLDFHTKALQHSNIPISWDEDEPQRVKTLKRKFNADQLADLELKEFLASDESDSNDDDDDEEKGDKSEKKHKDRDKYRALILSGDGSDEEEEEDGTQDMEVTFNTGLEDLSKRILEKKDKKSETVWEAYLRKRREKKKARKNNSKYSSDEDSSDADEEMEEEVDDFFIDEPTSKKDSKKDAQGKGEKVGKKLQDRDRETEASTAELELLLSDVKEGDNGPKGYSLKPKKAKGKKGKEVQDENKIPFADYDDPRFASMFTSPKFALDPTDPQFKRSAAYARQMAQKQLKGDKQEHTGQENRASVSKTKLQSATPDPSNEAQLKSDNLSLMKEKHEINSLVRSIKMKSKQAQLPSVGKRSKSAKKLQSRSSMIIRRPESSSMVQPAKKAKKGSPK